MRKGDGSGSREGVGGTVVRSRCEDVNDKGEEAHPFKTALWWLLGAGVGEEGRALMREQQQGPGRCNPSIV